MVKKYARFTSLRDELAEQIERNEKLEKTLLSLQDKYVELCKEFREFRENTSLSTNIQ